MIRDAEDLADFNLILMWDQDRFSRGDMIEVAEIIGPLRRAGVGLESVTSGVFDLNDFTGRVMWGIKQELGNQKSVRISEDVARGIASGLENGKRPLARIPYGFDRLIFDATGNLLLRVSRTRKYKKQKDEVSKLVRSDDEATTVVWLFETYAGSAVGLRTLASELNNRGTKSPHGGTWSAQTIIQIFRNTKYFGGYIYGRTTSENLTAIRQMGLFRCQIRPGRFRTRCPISFLMKTAKQSSS